MGIHFLAQAKSQDAPTMVSNHVNPPPPFKTALPGGPCPISKFKTFWFLAQAKVAQFLLTQFLVTMEGVIQGCTIDCWNIKSTT